MVFFLMIVDDIGVKMVGGAMVSRDVNTPTAVGSISTNGKAPPWIFGAHTVVYVHCGGHRRWSTDRAGDGGDGLVNSQIPLR